MTDEASSEAPPAPRAPLHRRFLRSPGAWVVGLPLGIVIGLGIFAVWSAIHPLAFVAWSRQALGEGSWRVVVDEATMDYGDGWTTPSSWRWHVKGLAIIGLLPNRPSMLIDDIVLAPPRPSWKDGGLVLTIPWASVQTFDLHFEEVGRQPVLPPPGTGRFTIVIEQIAVAHFGMTMRQGQNPEVVLDATHVSLVAPFRVLPGQRGLIGKLKLDTAWVTVAGILIDDVHPSRIEFTGLGLEIETGAHLGDAAVDASLAVDPLIGRPEVKISAHLHEGTLDGLANAILGEGKMQIIGRVEVTASMVAGGALGPGNMEGTATVNVIDAGFSRPESHRAAVALAVRLAPFLHFDEAQNVVVGDFHGGVSFTQRGVSFDTLTYETTHSVGELRGYVRSSGMSAKLHFTPRKGSGAIEWGFILRGDLRKPKVALAVPAVLRAWTPCEDPTNCALRGGATTADDDEDADDEKVAAALEREARSEAAEARREARRSGRSERRSVRAEARTDRQAENVSAP